MLLVSILYHTLRRIGESLPDGEFFLPLPPSFLVRDNRRPPRGGFHVTGVLFSENLGRQNAPFLPPLQEMPEGNADQQRTKN